MNVTVRDALFARLLYIRLDARLIDTLEQ
jgi:hypothetical protein